MVEPRRPHLSVQPGNVYGFLSVLFGVIAGLVHLTCRVRGSAIGEQRVAVTITRSFVRCLATRALVRSGNCHLE
jgi:hypothetical protein